MVGHTAFESFAFSAEDPFAVEHADVVSWVEDAVASLGKGLYYQDVDLKTLPSGRKLLEAKPEQSRRYVMAAVIQTRHWDECADRIRAQAKDEMERVNPHFHPDWERIWGRRRQATAVVRALMRRVLPFRREDLLTIVRWCNASVCLSTAYFGPIASIVRAMERFASTTPVDPQLRDVMREFAVRLRSSSDKDAKRCGTTVEQLCVDESEKPAADARPVGREPLRPSPAGSPLVLDHLKRALRMLPSDEAPPATLIGPDQFPLCDDSPLRKEHDLLSALFEQVVAAGNYHGPSFDRYEACRSLFALDPSAAGRALLAGAERHMNTLLTPTVDYIDQRLWRSRYAAAGVMSLLAGLDVALSRDDVFDLLLYLSTLSAHLRVGFERVKATLLTRVPQEVAKATLSEGERYVLSLCRASLILGPPLAAPSEGVVTLTEWIDDGATFCLTPGEAWSDAVNDDYGRMNSVQRKNWISLLAHLLTATAARPSAKWLKTAAMLVDSIGHDELHRALERWLPLVSHGQTLRRFGGYAGDTRGEADVINEENATCLRGLLWLVQLLPRRNELTRVISAVALSAYKKVPGIGPRAVKVGNAAVYALSDISTTDAVGQLAMLKVRVKFGTAQKEIEKAFNTAAEALGFPRDQIEEMGVPSYGLTEVGLRQETLGEHRADLVVTGSNAELRWFDGKGKPLKSVPAKVKSDHKDDLSELKQSLKDIQAMLPAQRDRIDSMFLLEKSWPVEVWNERYLHHPLVGTIARRLVWCIDGTPATFVDAKPTDVHGQPVEHGKTADVTLWHPVGRDVEEVISWRRRLEELGVVQPFKQAHREVYLLTDAERRTEAYSNRFAAHVLRQHRFNALCAARGWKNKLRLLVDDVYPPATKELPRWGLRAEFWIEGIGDNFGEDTNESGVYLLLATDQVRFYRAEAALSAAHAGGGGYASRAGGPGQDHINDPLPLDQIPPLVFSEVMRDVDLFVGVASVGNDPAWQDGGPEGRYRDYWQSVSFGELSGAAATRKQTLERLIPRLKIANRCSFNDRFLVVQGDKRTYKIHVGSGNILMEPNDQYLCIVPDSRSRAKQDDLFLPFEGDATLSIIISKALLLAADTKINDPTIVRQING